MNPISLDHLKSVGICGAKIDIKFVVDDAITKTKLFENDVKIQ